MTLWDTTPQRSSRWARLVRRWRMGLFLLLVAGALAVLVVPLLVTGHRFERTLTAKNPLEQLAREAQPASATVFDSSFRNGGHTGFAYGVSSEAAATLLATIEPGPWQPGPPTPESPDMKLWKSGHLVLTVRVDPCHLSRCKAGDSLVYTEVLDVS